MLNNLLWFLFGVSISFGIVSMVLTCILIGIDDSIKVCRAKLTKVCNVCYCVFVFIGLFVSISWAFCDYWMWVCLRWDYGE
jgi:hypothetical protein